MRTVPLTPQQRREFYDQAKDIVLVDFDGTLCAWSYPEMGRPELGARHFMKSLIKRGLKPVVWSCRFSPEFNTEVEIAREIQRVGHWLARWRIPYHAIDAGNNGKALCLAYVDDRGVAYTGNWDRVLSRVDVLMEKEDERRGSAA